MDELDELENELLYDLGDQLTSGDFNFFIGAPDQLTASGKRRTFRPQTIQKIYENVKAAVDVRVNTLRQEVFAAYTRRSSGETYESIRSNVEITGDGVVGDFSVSSQALRFISVFGGGIVLPMTEIYPAEQERLVFIGREGRRVMVPTVTHPGFSFIGDPINDAAQALKLEVQQAAIDAVKDSTITWVNELNQESVKNLRRQYRYSSPAGRPG